VGRKPRAATRNLFLLKRKLFRKPTAAMIILKKINRLAATMILKKKTAHGNKNEHIEEDMKQKGIEVRSLIIEPLSDEQRNKINQIIKNREAKSGEIYIHYGNKKVSWGSM
jgi:hypothetical protein